MRYFGLPPRPSRDFVPAADLLSCARKKVGKESAPVPSPLRCAKGSPAMLGAQGRAELTSLRCVQTCGAKSEPEARCARALGSCASRLLQRGTPSSQQPTARPASRLTPAVRYAPFSTAEQRRGLRACAKRTSRTDFARLSERSVAKRVPREPARPEQRREPEAQRRAGGSGAASLVTFLGAQESDSPAGAKSPLGLRTKQACRTRAHKRQQET